MMEQQKTAVERKAKKADKNNCRKSTAALTVAPDARAVTTMKPSEFWFV